MYQDYSHGEIEQILDVLICGRSRLTFQYKIQQGTVTSSVTTLDQSPSLQAILVKPRQVVGVGNVGRTPGQSTYTLYHPYFNQIEFRTVHYGLGRGFQTNK